MEILKSTDPRRIDLEGRVLVAHQAEFMPWLGFISKASMADVYFILDNSQYKNKYFENRNKIRSNNEIGWIWLTAPVTSEKSYPNLQDVSFVNYNFFKKKLIKTVEYSYRKAPFFTFYFEEFRAVIDSVKSDKLVDFNITIIKHAFDKFNIRVPIYTTSSLLEMGYNLDGKASELVIQMCKIANANIYIQGQGGKKYHDRNRFKEEGIQLVFQKYEHPVYSQFCGNFIPNMSFIDVLFNYSTENAIKLLGKSNFEF